MRILPSLSALTIEKVYLLPKANNVTNLLDL